MTPSRIAIEFYFERGRVVVDMEPGDRLVHFHWRPRREEWPYYNCGLRPGQFEANVKAAVQDNRVWGEDVKAEDAVRSITLAAQQVYDMTHQAAAGKSVSAGV